MGAVGRIAAGLGAAVVATVVAFAAPASAGQPTVSLSRNAAAPGEVVVVELANWPPGPVALAVCGNNALRGDVDCDLRSSSAVASRDAHAIFDFTVGTPPVPCPC